MTQSELSFRKLHQAGHAGPWEGTEPEARRQEGGLEPGWTPQVPSFPGAARAGRGTQTPSRSDAPPAPDPRTPVLPEVPPPSTLPCLSHPLCIRSSSGTPREGPAGGTGGSGGPGGSLGSRGRRRKLYSAVPGRSFMAVKSYQAQAEGEISLSKGEKIKGKGAVPGGAVDTGQAGELSLQEGSLTNRSPAPRMSSERQRPQRHLDAPSASEEHRA